MALILTLAHPPATFLYRATVPRVLIDDVPQPVTGWGEHRFELSPGPHRVHVHVPYVLPRRAGRADLEVVVPDVGDVPIEYLAPTFTLARGSLGPPGAQVSTGASAVRMANIVTLVVVVLAVVVLIALD
jgi:hypothetical protein